MPRFPFSAADPVAFPGPPPAACDVVIIGGGVIGVTTGLFLARQGVSVTLLEKGRIAAEQSSRNWGWVRKQGRDAAELPIMIEAGRLWQQLAQESGEEIGLRQTGVTYLAETDQQLQGYQAFMALAAAHGLDTRLLDGDGVARLLPGLSRRVAGAMITPSDQRAEPWLAVPALARLAAREGLTVVENCAVRALDIAAGRITGVLTEAGRIAAATVLVAGGAWSSLLLRRHGVSLPQLSVRATVAATEPLPEIHAGAVSQAGVAFRRRQDGGYTLAAGGGSRLYLGPDAFRHIGHYLPALRAHPLATRYAPWAPEGYPDAWGTPRHWPEEGETPFERMRVLNPPPAAAHLRAAARNFAALFPELGPVRLRTSWAGMIDTMPDFVPVLDQVAAIPGLFVATGMSGHGFGIGPGIGRVMADLIRGDAPGHDLHRFRLSRFSDGSRLQLGPFL